MTQRQLVWVALAAVLVIGAAAIGYALAVSSRPTVTPSPTPTSSEAFSCEVSLSPTTIRVNPDTGDSEDLLFFAGTGFPRGVAVSIFLTVSVLDLETDGSGSFTAEVRPAPEVTYPAPPGIRPGPLNWTVTAWDAPTPPGEFATLPPKICERRVEVTLEFTHAPSAPPPTDLSPGNYAEVVADGVRVRVEPSTTATVVGALFVGDVVRILAPAVVVEGYVWYRIETVVTQSGESRRGYVAAGSGTQAFLQPTTEPPSPTASPTPSPTPASP